MEFEKVHRKIALLGKHYKKDGRFYSVEDREWLVNDLFIPADDLAFHLWPRNVETLDEKFIGQIGLTVEWTEQLTLELAEYEKENPGKGLRLVPIMVIVHNLQRGAGKTVGVAGCNLADMIQEEEYKISFATAAFKQAKTLLLENYIEPISIDRAMSDGFELTGDRLTYKRKGGKSSFLEVVETSFSSITGRRRNRVILDEARDIEGRTFAALLPSVRANAKFRCPSGHMIETYKEDAIFKCNVCKKTLLPRIPKVIVSSTSGVIENKESDWFMELVEDLTKQPNPFTHLYRDDNASNPALAKVEHEMISSVFGHLPSIATYIDVELNNNPRRKGADFVTASEYDGIVDKNINNMEGSEAVCFGFLDPSRVGDLTSIVIIGNDAERDTYPKARADAFRYVKTEHIKFWNPKDLKDCPKGRIEREVVEDYLCDLLWKFPNLIDLQVDVRGTMGWAIDMVADIRAGRIERARPFRFKVRGMVNLQGTERNIAWAQLENRIKSKTWRTFPLQRLRDEVLAVRKTVTANGQVEIKDRNRKVKHADVLEGAAQNMYRIHKYMIAPKANFLEANSNAGIQSALKSIFDPNGGSSETALISEKDF